jgi:hypothetical protein
MRESNATRQRLADLERAQGELRRRIAKLSEAIRVEENSQGYLIKLLDKQVAVLVDREESTGVLRWFDRYNIGIQVSGDQDVTMFGKGHITSIKPSRKEG